MLIACGDGPRPPREATPEITLAALPAVRPEAVPFGRIADLELGADGSVFVLDGLNHDIRVFDATGRELRSFGRTGQGPGELAGPTQLLWGPRGNLWVLDPRNGRLTVFSLAGEVVGTRLLSDLPIFFAFAFTGTDTLEWVGVSSLDAARPTAAWVESRVSRDAVTPLTRMDLPFVEWPPLFEYRGEGIAVVMPAPFAGQVQFGFDGIGRLWYAYTGVPRVYRWSPAGDLDLTLSVNVSPMSVTSADRQAALASDALEEVRTFGQAAVAEMSDLIPDNKPPLAGFFFDDQQRVWIAHGASDATGSIEREIEIFDLDGTPVARTRARLALQPRPRIRDGVLAAVIRDELGIESVALYRIEP